MDSCGREAARAVLSHVVPGGTQTGIRPCSTDRSGMPGAVHRALDLPVAKSQRHPWCPSADGPCEPMRSANGGLGGIEDLRSNPLWQSLTKEVSGTISLLSTTS